MQHSFLCRHEYLGCKLKFNKQNIVSTNQVISFFNNKKKIHIKKAIQIDVTSKVQWYNFFESIMHYLHHFFSFPSSLTFHNMSSMQAAASSAVSWPQTGRNIHTAFNEYTLTYTTSIRSKSVQLSCSDGLYILN